MKSWRLWIITALIAGSYSALLVNVYHLQVQNGTYFAARAASQASLQDSSAGVRGAIYFTDNKGNKIAVATNREFPVIFAVPKEIADVSEAAHALAPVVHMSVEKLSQIFSKKNDTYEELTAKATDEQATQVKDLNIKGVYVDSKYYRYYPSGSLAAHLLGYVGPNNKNGALQGQYGVEAQYDSELRSHDLLLTIDVNIQTQAEKILKNLIDQYHAAGGSVIVEDPKTGKVLAMGSYPTFDPNDYAKYPIKNFTNPAVQAIYEPGSVFKVLTMSAGIDSGKITPNTTFTDTGSLTLNGKTIKNWDLKAHGKVTMTNVIEESLNTGAAFAERTTGNDIFYNYLVKFGLNDPSGIGLPGEVSGKLRNLVNKPRAIDFASASFGQGVSVTPLELVGAVGAIANDGGLMKPFIIDGTAPEQVRTVMSKSAADQVTAMMMSAVRKAEIAQIPGYEIAGKTGTAQVFDPKKGGYGSEYIHSYVGFAPASDPKFLILMRIDKPRGAPLAGLTVVPAFRELAQFILNYENIPADNLPERNK